MCASMTMTTIENINIACSFFSYLYFFFRFGFFLFLFSAEKRSGTYHLLNHIWVWSYDCSIYLPGATLLHGIHIRFSRPYTTRQNCKTECYQLHCLMTLCSSFYTMPSYRPAFGLKHFTATHVLNRLPTKTITASSPYFALYNRHPSYITFYTAQRVFGFLHYPNIFFEKHSTT